MKTSTRLSILGLAFFALTGHAYGADFEDAIADSTRPEGASDRDAARHPAAIMEFSGIAAGDSVVEILPGGGYYTALLSRVVGDSGEIYAVEPERIFEHYPNLKQAFPAYLDSDPRSNVSHSVQKLDEMSLDESVDQVWMILYYHDTFWTGVDRAKMNKAVYDMLKPGGVYLVSDHSGKAGAGDSITKDLHRMDEATAKSEIEAAGFRLDGSSDALAHPEDPRDDSVFSPERRGKSDRFVLRYVKPE